MAKPATLGWDIGGAHVKAVLLQDGRALDAVQIACPLWRGMDRLEQAVQGVMQRYRGQDLVHAVTMTGELADIFPNRAVGVSRICAAMRAMLPDVPVTIYAGPHGLLHDVPAEQHLPWIASANWHASAVFLAARCRDGLFLDIGSTTTDIIALQDGKPCHRGFSDAQRLATGEMVYTGAVRTPLIAVAQQAPFEGAWQGLAAEHFATMADIYRLTGELAEGYDMAETPDGAGKTLEESARRLARMTGRDFEDAPVESWKQLATYFRSEQLGMIESAVQAVLSRVSLPVEAPLLAAGAGRFLVHALAARLGRPCVDAETLLRAEDGCREWTAACLPAYAVAWLMDREQAC